MIVTFSHLSCLSQIGARPIHKRRPFRPESSSSFLSDARFLQTTFSTPAALSPASSAKFLTLRPSTIYVLSSPSPLHRRAQFLRVALASDAEGGPLMRSSRRLDGIETISCFVQSKSGGSGSQSSPGNRALGSLRRWRRNGGGGCDGDSKERKLG